MVNSLLSMLMSFLIVPSQTPEFRYDVHGSYERSINKFTLIGAKSISDIIPNYPSQWIKEYDFVEVKVTSKGNTLKAAGKNLNLSTEQKNILHTADIGADVAISIGYIEKNAVTDTIQNATMLFQTTVIPDKEAEYHGGYQQLKEYLQENGINKLTDINSKDFKPVVVNFTVNEQGGISNAHIYRSSLNPKIDNTLIEVINKMPKWKPAETTKGVKVKQNFKFSVFGSGNGDGC
ncbi:MAG: energy transducer TonB [Ignavibacteria bacterium]|nr:energy transducer TonB [Ignavibacteria bacterium]